MDEDTEAAAWHQQELDERRQREDLLIRRCRRLTDEKNLTDEKFNNDWQRFMRTITKGNEHGDYS